MIGEMFTRDGVRSLTVPDLSHNATRIGCSRVADATVLTKFLGFDIGLGKGHAPLIFQTTISGGPFHGATRAYATEEQAMVGHLEALGWLRAGVPPFHFTTDSQEQIS